MIHEQISRQQVQKHHSSGFSRAEAETPVGFGKRIENKFRENNNETHEIISHSIIIEPSINSKMKLDEKGKGKGKLIEFCNFIFLM